MKLRIHADSIRLRLKQAEVQALVEGREVVEVCPTVPAPLSYALRPDPAAVSLGVRGEGSRVTITIPSEWVKNWHDDERVGFDGVDGGIRLIVEKDFKCLHPQKPEENADCYENPEARSGGGGAV